MHSNSLPPSDRDEVATVTPTACNELLREKILLLRDAPGSTWNNTKIAKSIFVSTSQISQYLSVDGCKYDGDVKGLERKLDDFLRNEQQRRLSGVDTIWTDVGLEIKRAFQIVRQTNDLGVFVAPSGAGKTRGADLLCAESPLIIRFDVRSWAHDKGAIYNCLWERIPTAGWNGHSRRANFIVATMVDSGMSLLIDDAHKLTRPALQLIVELHEDAGIPTLMLGMPDILTKLKDDPQRLRRIGLYWPAKSADPSKNRPLLDHMVKSLAPDANGDHELLVDLSEQIASGQGGFGSVHKQLKLAAEFRRADKIPWPKAFRNAHKYLIRQTPLN